MSKTHISRVARFLSCQQSSLILQAMRIRQNPPARHGLSPGVLAQVRPRRYRQTATVFRYSTDWADSTTITNTKSGWVATHCRRRHGWTSSAIRQQGSSSARVAVVRRGRRTVISSDSLHGATILCATPWAIAFISATMRQEKSGLRRQSPFASRHRIRSSMAQAIRSSSICMTRCSRV